MQDHTMQHKKKMPAFRCLVIIIDSNIRDKLTEFLTDAPSRSITRCTASAPSVPIF